MPTANDNHIKCIHWGKSLNFNEELWVLYQGLSEVKSSHLRRSPHHAMPANMPQ